MRDDICSKLLYIPKYEITKRTVLAILSNESEKKNQNLYEEKNKRYISGVQN